MKKQILLCALLSAALFTVSCSNDNKPESNEERVALNVIGGIQTRAYDSTWEKGDAIGIYMVKAGVLDIAENIKNYKYVTTEANGRFTPAVVDKVIYFPVDGSKVDFMAYYPYATIGGDNIYNVNVTSQVSQKAIDLMGATKVQGKDKTNPSVAFVFGHKLVKLEIAIQGDQKSITDAELVGTVVKITNQQTAATYNVLKGGGAEVTKGNPSVITLLTKDLKTEGIVLPNIDTEGMMLTFAVPALNYTLSWAIKTAPKSQKFEAGKKYKYTITIGKEEMTVTSTVTDWIAGNGEDGENGSAE